LTSPLDHSSDKGHKMTDRQYVRNTLREMLIHYSKNIGKPSKYTGDIITHKMISVVTLRYLELGGTIISEEDDTIR